MPAKAVTVPTVDQMLGCIVGSMQTQEEVLGTYANLGFWYDGVDRTDKSRRSLSRFVREIDQVANEIIDNNGGIHVEDLEGEDDVVIRYLDSDYRFRAPTLKDRIKNNPNNLGAWLREMIDCFGDPAMLRLPYPAIVQLTQAASQVAGFL